MQVHCAAGASPARFHAERYPLAVLDQIPKADRCIAHVDMDAFYASVEQRDRPEFRGLPVLVGGSGQRGVVAAASYEARHFGIRSAMPASEARRRCPQAIFLPPRMSHYKGVSRQIFRVFAEFTPDVEGLSMDEAFLDLTASLAIFGSVESLAARIKDRIREETSLTASVGVGPNKLVAKIASDLDKPDGLCMLFGDRIRQVLDPLPARHIGGIGPRTAARLDRLGIRTIRDLRVAPERLLDRVFGRHAGRIREKAGGIDHRPVCPHHPDQSISAEETFDRDMADALQLGSRLAKLSQRVANRIRDKRLQGATITVKIRKSDFSTFSRQRRISPPTADPRTIARVAQLLLEDWLDSHPESRLRLLGVGISGLSPASQLSLFDTGGPGIEDTVDSIRRRFGDDAVRRARALDHD